MDEKINVNYIRDKKRFLAIKKKVLEAEEISEENKLDFKNYIEQIEVDEVKYGRRGNVASYFYIYCTKFFPNKHIASLTKADYNSLALKLKNNEILNNDGKPYSDSSSKNFLRFFRAYFNIVLGENRTKEVLGKLKIKEDDYDENMPYLTFEHTKILLEKIPFKEYEIRFVLAFMFSTGCRVGEMRNMKIRDVYKNQNEILVAKIPKIKTKERTIRLDLFVPQIEYYINDYLKGQLNKTENDLLIKKPEQTINRKLKEEATKILGNNFNWVRTHLIRHGSATYFAQLNNLTYNQYCYKFGWSVASRVPARYFNKEELGITKVNENIKTDEIHKYEAENKNLRNDLEKLKTDVATISGFINLLKISDEKFDIQGIFENLYNNYKKLNDEKRNLMFFNDEIAKDIFSNDYNMFNLVVLRPGDVKIECLTAEEEELNKIY